MRDFLQEFLFCRLVIAPCGGANLPGRSITAPERGFRALNGRAAALVNGDEAIRLRRQPAALEAAVNLRLVLPNPFDVMHGGSFRQSPLAPGLLSDRPGFRAMSFRHSAGLAAARAASLALSAAAFFSTSRTAQIDPS